MKYKLFYLSYKNCEMSFPLLEFINPPEKLSKLVSLFQLGFLISVSDSKKWDLMTLEVVTTVSWFGDLLHYDQNFTTCLFPEHSNLKYSFSHFQPYKYSILN